jgi:hypothetical protein
MVKRSVGPAGQRKGVADGSPAGQRSDSHLQERTAKPSMTRPHPRGKSAFMPCTALHSEVVAALWQPCAAPTCPRHSGQGSSQAHSSLAGSCCLWPTAPRPPLHCLCLRPSPPQRSALQLSRADSALCIRDRSGHPLLCPSSLSAGARLHDEAENTACLDAPGGRPGPAA